MTSVTWLSLFAVVLSVVAVFLGYAVVGIGGLVFFPMAAWYERRLGLGAPPPRFGRGVTDEPDDDDDPPSGGSRRRGRGPRRGGGGGGTRVPALVRPREPQPSGSEALPLPDE